MTALIAWRTRCAVQARRAADVPACASLRETVGNAAETSARNRLTVQPRTVVPLVAVDCAAEAARTPPSADSVAWGRV